jgi:phage gp16-like protein
MNGKDQRAENTRRRSDLARIHRLAAEAGLTEEEYRAVLERATGRRSAAELNPIERIQAIFALELLVRGYKGADSRKTQAGQPKDARRRRLQAQHPQARMIRALWLDLRDAGELRDASEAALAHFVKRTAGVDDLRWLKPKAAGKVISALRA